MKKIVYCKKDLVLEIDNSWCGIDEVLIDTNDWSNLLDAALNNDLEEVKSLLEEATDQEITHALSTLKNAYTICKRFESKLYTLYVSWLRSPESTTFGLAYSNLINPKDLKKAKSNILSLLIEHHSHRNLNFSDHDDRRVIEKILLEIIKNKNSLDELIELYNKYIDLPIMKHHRNPKLDMLRATFLFKDHYSQLKINFIEALQIKTLEILTKTDLSEHLNKQINDAACTIFSTKHKMRGVSKILYNQFNNNYLNQASAELNVAV